MNSSNGTTAWASLVHRSIEARKEIRTHNVPKMLDILRHWASLDEFLGEAPKTVMFWFFQRRQAFLSQKTMQKWSRDRLNDYVLLPATPGFVLRSNCFFVSHFWQTKDDPDPDGKYLRLLQDELQSQPWSYIWVDWTCIPQHPRSEKENAYFLRSLQTMPSIIRNSGFMWFYPPFEARLWILFEVAEYTLTAEGPWLITTDNKEFMHHIKEMLQVGVRSVLEKHGYRCSYDRDKEFLTSWLEALVLLKRLRIDIDSIRSLMDALTWYPTLEVTMVNTPGGLIHFCRYEGTLELNGARHTFTPFPRWVGSCLKSSQTESPLTVI